jgi:hypothetical protein
MNLLPLIHEMEILGVADRGVPNKERIILRPHFPIKLQNFILTLGILQESGQVQMARGFIFYFDEIIAEPPSWVVVYTGPGTTEISKLPTTLETAYSFHWGQPHVLFTRQDTVPVVFRVSGIAYEGAQALTLPEMPTQQLTR